MQRSRDVFAFMALAVVVLGVLAFAVFNPRWVLERTEGASALSGLSRAEILKAENDVRTAMVQALAGAFFLVTALLTWKGFRLSREGQITERFSRAVDQLGKQNEDSVRVGAVLSLERVARESKADRATIVKLLAVHIRSSLTTKANPGRRSNSSARRVCRDLKPDAAMAFIALARIHRLGIPNVVPGFREGSHQYADLKGIPLRGADMHGAYLVDVDLSEADLGGIDLNNGNLQGANFYGASLRNANLAYVNRSLKNPRGVRLQKADLRGAVLKEACLDKSVLLEAQLGVEGHKGADLGGAHLRSVVADGAWLEGVEMAGADLRNAHLSNAHMKRANLTSADLRGADFTQAKDLETVRLAGAKVDERTQPASSEFDWVAAGARFI
ncbi:pentapeptide repeat-containing protein [Streptomyces sp. NBC_01443]|uniref:pentapeptide repeat-containing protein n=1 Tax=Streptomyces sp. NBC_01443 TaxID=2903868 RepID=UPI0022534F47|nr:pentapeptide repeat-containing protein [Streptomyces sp. NBC_01443]MCX4632814.1 pentapeptide repeat-containing protein [Streptomyces sp. NBC_01443]